MTAPQVAKERVGHGLEVFLKNEYLAEAPHCPHGSLLAQQPETERAVHFFSGKERKSRKPGKMLIDK